MAKKLLGRVLSSTLLCISMVSLFGLFGGNHTFKIVKTSNQPRVADFASAFGSNTSWGTPLEEYALGGRSDGNYFYVTGCSKGGPFGGDDVFLAKVNNHSEIELMNWWGGAGTEFGWQTGVDSSGNVFVIGYTTSYGGSYGGLIIKYDRSGEKLWNISWGGGGEELFNDGIVAPNGVVYGVGVFGMSAQDAIIVKFDGNGQVLWNRTFGGTANDYALAVGLDDETNVFIAGFTQSWGAGANDIFLTKYDKNGGLLFNQSWGGPGNDVCESLVVDTQGSVTILGTTSSWVGTTSDNILLLHYDNSGNLLWNTTWVRPGSDFGYDLIIENDNTFVASGYVIGSARDIVLAKFSSSGTLVENTTWGTTTDDEGRAVGRIGNQIYVIGNSLGMSASRDIVILTFNISVPPVDLTLAMIILGIIGVGLIVFSFLTRRRRKSK